MSYFDLVSFKHTNNGLEMQGLGIPSEGLLRNPECWGREADVFISVSEELQDKVTSLWTKSWPLPGYWSAEQVRAFVVDMLTFLDSRFPKNKVLQHKEIWDYWVGQWDQAFNRNE